MTTMNEKHPTNARYEDRIKAKAYKEGVPAFGKISLTYRCNYNCVHCYCNLPAGSDVREREMSTATIVELLDQMANAGCLWLILTGGEPTLRRDFGDIYRAAWERGFMTSVFSNGSQIDRPLLKLFAERPPRAVEISLYGATAPTYERITRRKGSFAACLGALRTLGQQGTRVVVKTPILTLNRHEIGQLMSLAADVGVKLDLLPSIYPRIDEGGDAPLKYRLPAGEAAAAFLESKSKAEATSEVATIADRRERLAANDHCLFCEGGITEFHVDPYGRIGLCPLLSKPPYVADVTGGKFVQGWSFLKRVVREIRQQSAAAADTAGFSFQCPVKSFTENGSFATRVEYLDEIRDSIQDGIEQPRQT